MNIREKPGGAQVGEVIDVKVVIPGGSGQVGTILARAFHRDGDAVVVLSRQPLNVPWQTAEWDGATIGPWSSLIDGADVVINLAGRSVNCRYTAINRRAILESRVRSTRVVGEAIAQAKNPPRVWLQASTATIYSHRYDAPNDEHSGELGGAEPDTPPGWRFSIEVARAWEAALDEAAVGRTRKVALRSSLVMSPDRGGIFSRLYGLVRAGLGRRQGDGRQYVSWIHHEDFVRAICWLIERDEVDGRVNVTSPEPLPNAVFMSELRRAAGVPIGLPATRPLLEMGAILLRTESELVLKSRRVIPARLLEDGFTFRYPSWPAAAHELCTSRRVMVDRERM